MLQSGQGNKRKPRQPTTKAFKDCLLTLRWLPPFCILSRHDPLLPSQSLEILSASGENILLDNGKPVLNAKILFLNGLKGSF